MATYSPASTAMSLFSERALALLNDKGMSVTELARQTGMTRPGLSALLHGRGGNCTLETAERIAEALGAHLYELLRP